MDKWLRRLNLSAASASKASVFWGGLVVGTLLTLLYQSSHGAASARLSTVNRSPRTAAPGSFWLVVQVTFKSQNDVQTFEKAFAPLAAYVRDHEPTTTSYAMARSDKDETKLLIFERYTDKDTAYMKIHRDSEPFQRFRPQLAALGATIKGQSYLESGLGFV